MRRDERPAIKYCKLFPFCAVPQQQPAMNNSTLINYGTQTTQKCSIKKTPSSEKNVGQKPQTTFKLEYTAY